MNHVITERNRDLNLKLIANVFRGTSSMYIFRANKPKLQRNYFAVDASAISDEFVW